MSAPELEQLEVQAKDENLLSGNTVRAYIGYINAGRRWLSSLCAREAVQVPSGSPFLPGATDSEDLNLLPNSEFSHAFDNIPNQHSPAALALFLSFKCLEENRGRSTAEGIHAAFKNLWQTSFVFC